jgi:hypothetical protein
MEGVGEMRFQVPHGWGRNHHLKTLQPCGGPSETAAVGSNARGRLYTRKKHNVERIVVVLDGEKKRRENQKKQKRWIKKRRVWTRRRGETASRARTVPDTFFRAGKRAVEKKVGKKNQAE